MPGGLEMPRRRIAAASDGGGMRSGDEHPAAGAAHAPGRPELRWGGIKKPGAVPRPGVTAARSHEPQPAFLIVYDALGRDVKRRRRLLPDAAVAAWKAWGAEMAKPQSHEPQLLFRAPKLSAQADQGEAAGACG